MSVTNPFGTTVSTFPVAYAAPGIFVSPQGTNLALAADHKGNLVNAGNPLHSGDRATVYLTGQGFLNNRYPMGVRPRQFPCPLRSVISS